MKKIILLTVIIAAASIAGQAQDIRFNAYGGYVFDDHVDSYYSPTSYFDGKIKGGFQWGGGLEIRMHDYYGLEFLYLRQDTKVPMEYYSQHDQDIKHTNFDVGINYLMLGATRSMQPHAKAQPYGGFMFGAAIIDAKNPDDNTDNNATKFVWGLRGGVNVWASDVVGIKLQAQVLSVPQSVGGSLYFGTGGTAAGISTYTSIFQFGLGGGLTFKLGHHTAHK